MSVILRVLQVEDSENDAALILRVLEKAGYEVRSKRVEDPVEMREALEEQAWDVIIADYNLPGFDAPTALKILHEIGRDTPFLVVSGVIGEDVAVEMMKAGAHDYLMKNNLARLAPAVEREMREFRYRRELAHQRRILEQQSKLINLSLDAIITANASRVIETWNVGAEEIYGWAESEAVGEVMHRLLETSAAITANEIDSALRQNGHWEGELVHTRRDGQRIVVESREVLVRDSRGIPIGILEINRNVTKRRQMEERLRETQKAESIGVLAAGLAHEFNNLLTVVLGNANLALQDPCPNCNVKGPLSAVIESAQYAANLTRQLLAYAGKGAVVREPASLSDVAESTIKLMRASLPENIELRTELATKLPHVLMDPSQMQQVLTNLILNAAESIDRTQGGTVTVRTALRDARVCLEISDTGCGMDKETQNRVFDPFFTTKALGRGLGLPAAQGIVKSLSGEIKIDSTVGTGTRITVLLPVPQTAVPLPDRPPAVAVVPNTLGAVLIVDDDRAIRRMAAMILSQHGFQVYEASTSQEAIDRLKHKDADIRVVVLDMNMPQMNGDEALSIIAKLRPDLHVFLTSGYAAGSIHPRPHGLRSLSLLSKPYTGEQILQHMLAALESDAHAPPQMKYLPPTSGDGRSRTSN